MAAIGVSSALGAAILSRTLRETPSFNGFLAFAGIAAVIGGSLFLLLGREPTHRPTPGPDTSYSRAGREA